MKRIFLISIAIAALASCSKTTPMYEPAEEIAITPVNANITKAIMQTGEFKGQSFNVWSWFNPAPATSSIETFQEGLADEKTTPYVVEKPFIEKSNGKWGGQVAYFWPSAGSLVFAGYHAPALTADDAVTYSFTENENKMVFSNVSAAKVGATGYDEDIMYFNMTPSSYNKSSLNVSVDFKHALSWITVTLAKRVDPVIEAKITVKNVIFTNVVPAGTGIVSGSDPIEWVVDETQFTPTQEVQYIIDTPMEIDYDTVEEDGKTKYKTKLYTLDEYLFIPQDIKGHLCITYSVESTDHSEFTETYVVNLTKLKDGHAQTKWEPGKHYTYNLSIGTDEITVTPNVGGWDSEGADILIPLPEDWYDTPKDPDDNTTEGDDTTGDDNTEGNE